MTSPSERVTEVTRDGLTLDVLDEGPLEGEVVVLLHGFPERASSWRLVAPLLHTQGLRTLAVDQRGFSPRARPRGRRAYAITEYAEDALAVAAATGRDRVHLVGHDWGAVTAWVAATIGGPERVATLTALSVPHPEAFARSWFTSRQGLKSWYMLVFNIPFLPELLARRPGGLIDRFLRLFGMTDDDVARFRREIVDHGSLPGGLGWYRAIAVLDRRLLGSRVRVPTTLVWSDRDAAIARAGVDATPRYVEAAYELVVLRGVSHWIPVHAPEATAEAVLERVLSAGVTS